MYKPITDLSKCPNSEENNEKSIICSQVEAGKVSAGQLLCCSDGNCNDDVRNCKSFYNQYISKCHDVSTLDACRRTDAPARRVCDWQGSLFCLSARATSNEADYSHFHEAIEWMINRNEVEESYNVTGCLETGGYQYKICDNPPVGTINFSCNDLFEDGCNSCNWKNGKTVAPSRIKGELCEIPITITATAATPTSVTTNSTNLGPGKIITLTSINVVFLALGVTLAFFRKKLPFKRRLTKEKT